MDVMINGNHGNFLGNVWIYLITVLVCVISIPPQTSRLIVDRLSSLIVR